MYEYMGKVTNVVDGDTVDIDVDLGFHMRSLQRFRLIGINCPEVHGATRTEGLAASAYVRTTLLGQLVRIRTEKSDDFGRWLARVYLGQVDFNQSLIDGGFAVPYMVAKG